MAFTQEKIVQRINQIRKLKQYSVHDCASILGISTDQFQQFDDGTQPLTLPDILMLSIYFGVPMAAFFADEPDEIEALSLLDNTIRSNFTRLLQKVICARLNIDMEKHAVNAEDIHQATGIAIETIMAYKNGNLPISIDHLSQIWAYLEIPVETFIDQELMFFLKQEQDLTPTQWIPEYPEPQSYSGEPDDEPLKNLYMALKSLPKEDQAQMTKFLLEKLKTL